MDRSVAQGRAHDGRPAGWTDAQRTAWIAAAIGIGFVLLALATYSRTLIERPYDHFVWQAAAFLEGQAAIRYPTDANWYFQDVLPVQTIDGVERGLIPFPPLPAVLLLPFVAVYGRATDDQLLFVVLGAVDVGLCWWMLGRLRVRRAVRVTTTAFFAFGTVFWYTAQLATTWYQAHVVAVGLAMLAVGVAVGADPDADDPEAAVPTGGAALAGIARDRFAVDRRQFVAGLLFGLACTARLTVLFAAPFFVLVGSGGSWWRRAWSAGLGTAIPVLGLVGYNLATTGHVFHPAYEHLYALEAAFYPTLGYNLDWSIEDPRYIPQNLGIMLFSGPVLLPDAVPDSLATSPAPYCTEPGAMRGLFDAGCPLAVPRDVGMSVMLTSPAYLLALPGLRAHRGSRLATGAFVGILLVALVNLMHFSQGWVQFGYRFSNDFVPWALLLVALGAERIMARDREPIGPGLVLVAALVVLSVLVSLWGVVWGNLLGW